MGWAVFVIISAVIISVMALYLYHAGNQEVKEPKHTPRSEPRKTLAETPITRLTGEITGQIASPLKIKLARREKGSPFL